MCGICGYAGRFVSGLASKMNQEQGHRGPDGQRVFEDPAAEIALGHARLAILDLSEVAAQPMIAPDGRWVIVFNGEIYNYPELKANLVGQGESFVSTGDTEVLLRGLMRYGVEYIKRLNGIFALGLWDRQERVLYLIRDHLGVKPLYYWVGSQGELLFASEIKALLQHPGVPRRADFVALQQHMAFGHASQDRTAFQGIKRLSPGCYLKWTALSRKLEIHRYWQPTFGDQPAGSFEEAAAVIGERMRAACKRQLLSDVPVGVLLSGGLDSSLITALTYRQPGQKMECYTIAAPHEDNRLDQFIADVPYARMLAKSLGLHYHEIAIQPNIVELWPKLIWHLDEPIADPAAILCYLMCQAARQAGSVVLLSGQGADELFCGYPRYEVMVKTAWMQHLPSCSRRMISHFAHRLPGSLEGKAGAMLRRIRRVLIPIDQPPDVRFLRYCANVEQSLVAAVRSPLMVESLHGDKMEDDCLSHMNHLGLLGLHRMRERDLSIYLPNHNLLYTDKMSMATGVEARVPLLDMELVEAALRFPEAMHLQHGITKALLRKAAQGIVPHEIIYRPKAGLGVPIRKWMKYDLAEMWNDLTTPDVVKRRGWFDPEALRQIRSMSQEGKEDTYMLQWAILTIELWAQAFDL